LSVLAPEHVEELIFKFFLNVTDKESLMRPAADFISSWKMAIKLTSIKLKV
jgi:hypothetical protein